MKLVKRAVILLVVCTVKNSAHDFSASPGIVMLFLMQSVVYCAIQLASIFDAGVQCGKFCMADSLE